MRDDLLGLELDSVRAVLEAEGVTPLIMLTHAPRRAQETGGVLRVVYAADDGSRLIAARFLDPIADREDNP